MLKIARESLSYYLNTGKMLEYDADVLLDSLNGFHGVFVSLHKGRALRGCIGVMESKKPLYKLIQRQVIASGQSDPRFSMVKFSELPQLSIEISVLSEMKKIVSVDEIELGKHGIYIIKGPSSGTFLPQVAVTTGWSLEEFLGNCARDKVKIGWDGWKTADVFIYTAEVFSEKDYS